MLGGEVEVIDVPIPIDCTDGFGEAYYGRPEAFLEPDVRAAQSGWVLTDPDAIARGVAQLADDLNSGPLGRAPRASAQPARAGRRGTADRGAVGDSPGYVVIVSL